MDAESSNDKPNKLSNADYILIFERILVAIHKLKKGYFTLKKLRGTVHGYCDFEDGITLDWRKEFVATLIHEMIHLIEPDWKETKVMQTEKKIINLITEDDIICLLKIFIKKI